MLYGRDAELAAIAELIAGARAGRSGALVVHGDAGSGKTALLEHAVLEAAGVPLLRATCTEPEADLPFAGLHMLLRPALGRVNGLPAPQAAALRAAFGLADAAGADRFLAGLATLTVLSELAERGPLLCVCDDAHWMDQASATALLFAARRLDAEGVVLVFGSRGGGPLGGTTGLPELLLSPLDRDGSVRLLAEQAADLAPPVRDRIIELSQGNPLALVELPASLTAEQRAGRLDAQAFHVGTLPVSSRVESAFAGQIARLPESSRLLLVVAAADGSGELGVILRAAGVLGASLADLTPPERAGLIQLSGDTLGFRHPLVRSAAYQSAVSSVCIAAHSALAGAYAEARQPDRAAWHLAASVTGPDETAAAALEHAAESARERGGYAAEAAAYERAAQLSIAQEAKGRRLARAAEAALAAGQMRPAARLAGRASRMISDATDLARLAELRATIEFSTGSSAVAARLMLDGAVSIAASTPERTIRMVCTAVQYANFAGDRAVAAEAITHLATHPAAPDLAAIAAATTGLAHVIVDQLTAGIREIRDALGPLATTAGLLPPAMAVSVAGFALLARDDEFASELATAVAARCRAEGMISLLPLVLIRLCMAQQFLGRLADARATATEAIRVAADTGQHHLVCHLNGVLARIAAIEGDEPGCAELANLAASGDSEPAAAWATASLGLLDLTAGRFDAAVARLTGLVTGPTRHTLVVTFAVSDLAEAAAGAGREDVALAALARFEEFSSAAGQPWAEEVAFRCHALLGHDPEANFERAVRLPAAASRPFERARSELAYGRWLRRARRRSEARVRLVSALTIFSQLGAAQWAEQARSELRAAGATPPDRAGQADLVVRLTAQELQVARRAAAGLSNREIAAELFLSPRTVGYHLYKAYPKLGVTTRSQLAALIQDLRD